MCLEFTYKNRKFSHQINSYGNNPNNEQKMASQLAPRVTIDKQLPHLQRIKDLINQRVQYSEEFNDTLQKSS